MAAKSIRMLFTDIVNFMQRVHDSVSALKLWTVKKFILATLPEKETVDLVPMRTPEI